MVAVRSEGVRVEVDGLRKRTVAACSDAGVEATVCSGAGDKVVACSGAGIEDDRWRRRDGF
jgi:hypothetical protein